MINLKSFMWGMGAALGIYYITKKDSNGLSILDQILNNPSEVLNTAKGYAIDEAVQTIKKKLY